MVDRAHILVVGNEGVEKSALIERVMIPNQGRGFVTDAILVHERPFPHGICAEYPRHVQDVVRSRWNKMLGGHR